MANDKKNKTPWIVKFSGKVVKLILIVVFLIVFFLPYKRIENETSLNNRSVMFVNPITKIAVYADFEYQTDYSGNNPVSYYNMTNKITGFATKTDTLGGWYYSISTINSNGYVQEKNQISAERKVISLWDIIFNSPKKSERYLEKNL